MTTKQLLFSALILSNIGNLTITMEKNIKNTPYVDDFGSNEQLLHFLKTKQEEKLKQQKQINQEFLDAAHEGYFGRVQKYINDGNDINIKQEFTQYTALHKAALGTAPLADLRNHHVRTISILVKNGININAQDYDGNTAAHSLAFSCDIDMLEYLQKNKANLKIKNKNGKIPLDYALDHLLVTSKDSLIHPYCQKTVSFLQKNKWQK